MSGEQSNKVLDQRICLPEPDVDNITVLTKNLPNEPILPWHHFDSPWLAREAPEAEADAEAGTAERGDVEAGITPEQLTLGLALESPEVSTVAASPEAPEALEVAASAAEPDLDDEP